MLWGRLVMTDKGRPAVLWGQDFRQIVACKGSTFEHAPRITESLRFILRKSEVLVIRKCLETENSHRNPKLYNNKARVCSSHGI
jgi:hypothetical protein